MIDAVIPKMPSKNRHMMKSEEPGENICTIVFQAPSLSQHTIREAYQGYQCPIEDQHMYTELVPHTLHPTHDDGCCSHQLGTFLFKDQMTPFDPFANVTDCETRRFLLTLYILIE